MLRPEPTPDTRPNLYNHWGAMLPPAVCMSAYCWVYFVFWGNPTLQKNPKILIDLGYIYSIPFALFLGFGLVVFLTMIGLNRDRIYYVLKPSRSRIIGMVLLIIVTPVGLAGFLPVTIGWQVTLATIALGFLHPIRLFPFFITAITAHLIAYFVSGLIITSVPNKTKRFLTFCLIWAATYSFFALSSGFAKFIL